MFRTKSQKRKNCRDCPVARTADLLGDTWSLMIVRDLLLGPRRFSDLQSSLRGISSRTLASKLLFLERQDILSRQSFHEMPPRVEYRLTRKGRDFNRVIAAMKKYGEKYI